MSALRSKQSRFARLIAYLILWIEAQGNGWEVTLADGGVTLLRKVKLNSGEIVRATDREHMEGSLHYSRLAQDLNLFVDGEWITDGEHPAWKAVGAKWKSLDSEAAWGGDFGDANHFSLKHEGRA